MAPSSSSSTLARNYDVFLSFRGEDTRNTIVSHLYEALRLKGLFTFKDDVRIELGDTISDRLLEAIQTSWFALVIISVNHATSSWCLEELRTIMELHKESQIEVVPIFYGVEPSDVRKQTGSFEAAFQKYNESPSMSEKVLKWRDALVQVCNLAGTHSSQCMDEAEMIAKVVGRISTGLRIIKPTEMMNVVGMEAHMKRMDALLGFESEDEVRMIGIWGMGGIGKTTVAKCLYARFSHQYQACCFMENVSKLYNNDHGDGAKQLQTELLSVITRDMDIKLWSAEAGHNDIKSRLGHTKVFLVLDGVDKLEQIHALAKETSWFGPGSRIIITTRDRGLLIACQVNGVHEVKCLDDNDALQLFKQSAFRGGTPLYDGYEQLLVRASQLAHGLPSALVAFGSHLSQTTISDWNEELDLLETSPHEEIQKILMTSYNGLYQRDKIVFLHVACLFNGGYLQHITTYFDNGDLRLKHLVTKSLVDITMDGCVNMHFLVVQAGREIVCQESGGRPSEQRFLWETNEICDLLEDNRVSDKLEGLALHLCDMADRLPTRSNGFSTMINLKFLKFFQHMGDTNIPLQLDDGYGLSKKLKLLHWDSYPSKELHMNFRMDNFVEISLRNSNLIYLWNGSQRLPSLRRLYLTGSRNLIQLPDLSTAVNLEELIMEGCTRMKIIQGSISGSNLRKLNMINCDSLKDLLYVTVLHENNASSSACEKVIVTVSGMTETMMFFPTDLSIEGNIHTQLSGLSGNAEHLSFDSKQQIPDQWMTTEQKAITPQLTSASNSSKSLEIKQFSYVEYRAPFCCSSFSKFPCLTELKLINLNIRTIPDDISHLRFLETLALSGNDFICLPTKMVELAKLKYLSLQNCQKLERLPELTQVETLLLSNCVKLQSLPRNHTTNCLLELWLENCNNIQHLSFFLSRFTKLTYLDLSRHDFARMPSSIRLLSSLETLFFNNCKNLKYINELPLSVKYLYAHGCESLRQFSLSDNHSTKHIDLSHSFRDPYMKERLMEKFEHHKRGKAVTPAFACLPGRSLDHSEVQRKSMWWTVLQGSGKYAIQDFVIFVEIKCEEPFHLQFPAFSCKWNQEAGRVLWIDFKPNIYLSTNKQSEKAAPSYHTLIVHVPNDQIEEGNDFKFEARLLLSDESHFPNSQRRPEINFCKVEFVDHNEILVEREREREGMV